jgi:hypothetical protein
MLPQIDLPINVLTIPSTRKKINYRPFTVKEEKILLMAKENDSVKSMMIAIKQVMNNCTFGKIKHFDNLTPFDFEHIFIILRRESVGNILTAEKKCSNCDNSIPINIDLYKVKLSGKSEVKIIKVGDVVIEFKYPSIDILAEELDVSEIFTVFANMIYTVTVGDDVHKASDSTEQELNDFILSLPTNILTECQEFLDNMPKTIYEEQQKCVHCGHDNDIYVEGLLNFFD